jgi:predicted negative regulator of RcsB-dependent stress response
MTKTGEAARPPMDIDGDSLIDAIMLKRREITIGAIAVAAIGFTIFVWRAGAIKHEERAERAFSLAGSEYINGNRPLATSDLEKLVSGSGGTAAGTQASMLLAQILYEDGKWADGVKRLEDAQKKAAERFAAPIEGLIGAGLADQKKYDEATTHYLTAASKARFPADQDLYKAEAARVETLAGKRDDARKIWAELSTKQDSPTLAEAKIRLGELEAAPAGKD